MNMYFTVFIIICLLNRLVPEILCFRNASDSNNNNAVVSCFCLFLLDILDHSSLDMHLVLEMHLPFTSCTINLCNYNSKYGYDTFSMKHYGHFLAVVVLNM